MKVIVNGKEEVLSLMVNGTECVGDFIGNYGALEDGQFTYDDEYGVYLCRDQETFNWWAKVVSDHQALEDRLAELRDEYGADRVQDVLASVGSYDLEDEAAAINEALDEEFA